MIAGEAGDGSDVRHSRRESTPDYSGGASPSHPLQPKSDVEHWADRLRAESPSYAVGMLFSTLVHARDDLRRARQCNPAAFLLQHTLDDLETKVAAVVAASPCLGSGVEP